MIRVKEVTVPAGNRMLLSGVCLEVSSGEVLGVYGPNGAGKSTLLRALAGVLPYPHSGMIEVDGVRMSSRLDPVERSKKILRLGSDFHASSGVRVSELFELAARSGSPERTIRETVELLDLEEFLLRDFSDLSDGQKQWVMFGRAWIQNPRVLVFDETFSKLDIDRLARLKDLIRQRVSSGGGVVVASHDLNRLASWSDRLLFLASGRRMDEGPVNEVFHAENLSRMYPGARFEVDSGIHPTVRY